MTTAYKLATVEDESGASHAAELLWTPTPDDAADNGFVNHNGLIITGAGDEDEPPAEFVALGHGHTWTALWEAATAYMQATWAVPDLYTDPVTRMPVTVDVLSSAPERRHAVFLRHPGAEECGCEWDGTWRLVYVEPTETGAVEVTVMRNPAVTV
jgi:hypothetical protein